VEASGKRYIIYGSRKDVFTFWHLADLHIWNSACDFKKVKQDIQTIKDDPFAFWQGGGDYADYIGFDDKRFDPDCVPQNTLVKDMGKLGKKQAEEVRGLFEPIKHKCLGLIEGNHEKQYQRRKDQSDLHSWLCTELNVPNLKYSALFDVVFSRQTTKDPKLLYEKYLKLYDCRTVRFFVHHGAGFAQTPGGKLNRLIQFMQMFDADIFFCAHVHDQVGRRDVTISANESCTKLTERVKLGVVSGSYLKTYSQGTTSYGEQRGYRPTTLGSAMVSIKPQTGEIKGEI